MPQRVFNIPIRCLAMAILAFAAFPAAALTIRNIPKTWSNKNVCAKTFQDFDHNHDKIIVWSEWPGTRVFFDTLDDNSDRVLTEVEFEDCKEEGNDPFDQLDRNRDGVLSRKEWPGSRAEFERIDDNRDGQLTRDEFYRKREGDQYAFDSLDSNRDGIISPTEWRGKMSNFKKLDADHNGVITVIEYSRRGNANKPLIK